MEVERYFHRVIGLSWREKRLSGSDSWTHDLIVHYENGRAKACVAFISKKLLERPSIAKLADEKDSIVSDETVIWVEEVKIESLFLKDGFVTRVIFSAKGSSYCVTCYSDKELSVS